MYAATRRMEGRLWWYRGMQRIIERLLERYVNGTGLDILDAGCGTGGATAWLERWGRVTGVDLSDVALGYCRQRGLRRLARASVTSLPLPDGRFDLVTSFDVLYHLWVDDLVAVQELARVLRPGGFLLVRVAAYDWLRGRHDQAGHTRHRYTRGELRDKLLQSGLVVRAASYANGLLFPVAAAKRLVEELGLPVVILRGAKNPSPAGGPILRSAQNDSSNLQPPTDFWLPPAPVNAALGSLLGLEAGLVARSALPVGLSVVALAQKPAAAAG